MELVKLETPEKEMWRVKVEFQNGRYISVSDVVGVDSDDPDFIKVNQDNGDYLLVFHTGRPQYMEVVAQ